MVTDHGLSALNTNSSSVTIYTDSSTTYSYLATSNNGCTFSDTLTVNVYNAKAVIDTTLLTGCEGVTMIFDNGSDESLNYYWIVDEWIRYLTFQMILYIIWRSSICSFIRGEF